MKFIIERWKSIRTFWKILAYVSCFLFSGSTLGFADARSDAQSMCNQKLGFAGIAVKNSSSGQTKWVCGCRGAFMWNQDRSACVKRQPNGANGADTANQQPPDDSREPSNADDENNQQTPPVVRISPKRIGEGLPSGRTRQEVQSTCSKQLGFAGVAVKDNSNGKTNWVCGCRSAFRWNQDGSACVKRQSNSGESANQQSPETPPIATTPRKKETQVPPAGRTQKDMQLVCNKQLGFAGIAVKDNSNGQTNWVCDCRSAFRWNQDGSACEKRQSNDDGAADQQQPKAPPVIGTPRKSVKRVPPRQRKKRVVRDKKKQRVVRSKPAMARGYCRRRYGGRLVKVVVKGSKFYCHYKGKRAIGSNPRIKWKKIKFRNLR